MYLNRRQQFIHECNRFGHNFPPNFNEIMKNKNLEVLKSKETQFFITENNLILKISTIYLFIYFFFHIICF
jgi:hypothetical protein